MTAQHSQYLESKVFAAPPHRLHLMLIDGALRYGRQAEDAWSRNDQASAAEALLRVIDIVGEMLAGVREQKGEVNRTLADLYWFLFRRVTEAKINSDAESLADAMRILEYERETWQMVCEKLSDARDTAETDGPREARLSRPPSADTANSRISLEA